MKRIFIAAILFAVSATAWAEIHFIYAPEQTIGLGNGKCPEGGHKAMAVENRKFGYYRVFGCWRIEDNHVLINWTRIVTANNEITQVNYNIWYDMPASLLKADQ